MLYQWRVENQSMCLLLGTAEILLFQGGCGRFFTMSFSSWLREKGHYLVDNITYKETYIPSRVTWGESCHCGFCKSVTIAHTHTEKLLKTAFLLVSCLQTRILLTKQNSEGALKDFKL